MEVRRHARGATAYNCTACRRYGVMWIYDFEGEGVHVSGPTQADVPELGDCRKSNPSRIRGATCPSGGICRNLDARFE
jgi:hypothetical protein